jgi:uncharacterized protein YceH (UPF0502 family)
MEMNVFAGPIVLGSVEVRVLGCLLEKQRTTPDVYPLSANALRLACNQSTNREPVVDYDDAQIREALHGLERRGLVRLASGRGSRAAKYRHLLADALPMGPDEQAVMTVLMLRGAQTPGELKLRSERMHAFAGLEAVSETLERLIERGLAERLPRRAGQKEERFAQLLQGGVDAQTSASAPAAGAQPDSDGALRAPVVVGETQAPAMPPAASEGGASLAELAERVARLEREVEQLRARAEPEPPA